ncbi:UNVERIFIED_ORG: hypothetical protein ABIC43_006658 [Variovorax guangxiensis]
MRPEQAWRTGRLAHLKREVLVRVANVALHGEGCPPNSHGAPCDLERRQSRQGSHDERNPQRSFRHLENAMGRSDCGEAR